MRSILICAALILPAFSQTIRVHVDATNPSQRIWHSSMVMPAKPGPLTLLYPQWIPGDHQPTGPIADLVGLKISASGKPIPWTRDRVDMYTFHLDVPQGATSINVDLDFILAPGSAGIDSNSSATPQLFILNWHTLLLYPKGVPADQLNYQATLNIPPSWNFGTALPLERESGGSIEFKPSSLTTLVDSPVVAGRYFRTVDLNPGGAIHEYLHAAGDSAAAVEIAPAVTDALRKLVKEEAAVFGPGHFRDYHFLVSLSDHILFYSGLEHHESSDNRFSERALQSEESRRYIGDVLPHEMAHSWNGKYRRPDGLATRDFSEPQKGDLLWVYEGLTDYYGRVMAARSGIRTADDFRDEIAEIAARLSNQAGRNWRSLEDTAIGVQTTFFAREDYYEYRRGAEYYQESTLIWLDADVLIRKLSNGAKSLDDFCHIFTGGPAGMPAVKPYTFSDIVATLNQVQPYDWAAFLKARIQKVTPAAPLGGIEGGGWKLIYNDTRADIWRFREDYWKALDFSHSIGINLQRGDTIVDVGVTSKAFAAGIAPASKLIAVNGRQYTPEVLRDALKAAKNSAEPIELLVKNGEFYKTHRLDYHDGERYPHLERDSSKPDVLSEIAKPTAK